MMNAASVNKDWEIVEKALRILREYPLCDSCLGRMFALLGRGLTNAERGRALKTLIVMELHRRIRGGDTGARKLLEEIAPRLRPVVDTLYRELHGAEPRQEPCYICGSDFSTLVKRAADAATKELATSDARTFLVAAHVPAELQSREDEVKTLHRLQYSEGIGSEVKREVSKHIQRSLGLKPDFENPDVLVNVMLSQWTVRLQYLPLLLRGRYWKLARRVSQSIWVTGSRERRYPFSIEDGISILADIYDGQDAILHGAGREDADVRMLGTGRPFIVEVKEARRRSIGLVAAELAANKRSDGLARYMLEGRARRADVASLKGIEGRHSKVYKALVVTALPFKDDDLARLETFFRNRGIRQRTPRRVRHRRPDVVRERIVFSVATRRLGGRVFEALIHTEGGLYIKELVSGDNGDTEPSFSAVLGVNAYCAELDVVGVLGEDTAESL